MAKFDLGNTLADVLGSVSKSDAAETLQQIDINLLDADERNFYALDGIDDLAANIELCGLQQPIRVRANPDMPGRYRIVSGHRRRAALWTLYQEAPERWGKVPCIVEADEISPAMEELRLIYANANTRKLTDADLAKQAERVQDLLYQLKEEGVEFPGRMRDHVAAACQVSASKLANLKIIRENLIPELAKKWEQGKLVEQSALVIAHETPTYQRKLMTYYGDHIGSASKWYYDNCFQKLHKIFDRECKANGAPCQNAKRMMDRIVASPNSYHNCEYHCCALCPDMHKCKTVCERLKDKAKIKKEEKKAEQAAEAKRAAERDRPEIELCGEMWRRWNDARLKAGKSVKDCYNVADVYYCSGDDTRAELYASGSEKISTETNLPYHYNKARAFLPLIKVAKYLNCSADYLLGLSDDLTTVAAQPQGWQTGEPTEPGLYAAQFFLDGMTSPIMEISRWDSILQVWKFRKTEATIDMECVGWYKIPEV